MTGQEAQIKIHDILSEAQETTFFTVRVSKQWKKLPREAVESPALETQRVIGQGPGQHASAGLP